MATESGSGDVVQRLDLHGHPISVRVQGEGPPLVLIHGITSSSACWGEVVEPLAERHTVIAPDLLGHGESDKAGGDLSLGALANMVRDMLLILGYDRATIVGHSLGGGVAMQFAYQYPERVERLALVSSGGLGREVHPLLRAATLPGADWVMPALAKTGVLTAGATAARVLERVGLRPSADLTGMADGLATLADPDTCRAFLHTARSILDPGGQRVDATDRLYLAAGVPVLILWGARDPMIPVAHGRRAHELMSHSRLEVFDDAGHFPFRDEPLRFVRVLQDFMATTEPGTASEIAISAMLGEVAA